MTTLTSADGHQFDAYETGEGTKGLIVVQEIFGVNHHIRSVTDRAAAAGYRAIAPAFFDRIQPGIELGYEPEDLGTGVGYAGKLNWDDTMADVTAAAEHLRDQGCTSIGITGFCWGGSTTWRAAAMAPVQAAVGYYGGGVYSMNDLTPAVPTMLHFGALDAYIPMSQVDEITAAHPEVIVHTYDADHGFHCDERASFDATASALAWERTLAFFAEHL